MVPPTKQKYLVRVDRSEIKTIKFKNGFPPKMIKSRSSFEKAALHQPFDLMECESHPKGSTSTPLMRNASSHYKVTPQQKPRVQSIPHCKRTGFAPSTVKQNKSSHDRPVRKPFSPPPTLSELKSLTKKIGRFYTVRNDTATTVLTPVGCKQRAILDIEKALSNKDLKSLENCYKRLFNGNTDPIRTMLRNQSFPNQRSRQAMCPSLMHGTASSTRSSPVWSKNVQYDIPEQRSWSADYTEERLPIVPAPYFRHETSNQSRSVKKAGGERPVMFSSTRQDYRERVGISPSSTVFLNLDPDQFPEPVSRSFQLERTNRGISTVAKNPVVYRKSPLRRAPTSTPEPVRTDLRVGSDTEKDLLPQVFPAQFRYNSGLRSTDPKPINSKDQSKLSKSTFDRGEANVEPQSSEASSDRNEILKDALTEEKPALTSGEDSDTGYKYNVPATCSSATQRQAENLELISKENSSVSSEDIKERVAASRVKPDGTISHNETEEISDLTRESSMVENIDLQKLEINSVCSSNSGTGGNIQDIDSGTLQESISVRSRKSDTHPIRESDMDNCTANHMEGVDIVVVNVTTEEGEDVNADIYEYEIKKQKEQFEESMELPEESNKENSHSVTRNRKEELEALLKEHSSIVEEIKNLSENFDV